MHAGKQKIRLTADLLLETMQTRECGSNTVKVSQATTGIATTEVPQKTKKEWNSAICNNVDGPREYYA